MVSEEKSLIPIELIEKSINIRVSGYRASKIPIIILGNIPVTESYYSKVDQLKKAGIIQGFWSVNPNLLDNNGDNIKNTAENGFVRIDSYSELESNLEGLFFTELEFFSTMRSRDELGKIIEVANPELDYKQKAEKFLSLIRGKNG